MTAVIAKLSGGGMMAHGTYNACRHKTRQGCWGLPERTSGR